jgi:hypothetical protein
MSDDMVIPDDVLEAAEKANPNIFASKVIDEYRVIARWARDEALKPFREAEEEWRHTPYTGRLLQRDWHKADIRLRHAVFAALRSGTADTNPKGDDHG